MKIHKEGRFGYPEKPPTECSIAGIQRVVHKHNNNHKSSVLLVVPQPHSFVSRFCIRLFKVMF